MYDNTVIAEELEKAVGIEVEPKVFKVESGLIKRLAEAVEDSNPLWRDEAYARNSRYGGIIAPPTFLQDQALIEFVDKLMEIECPLKRLLNGGMEVEWYKPMRPGDLITTRAKLVKLTEKEGKAGKLLFMDCETSFTNQLGELVARGTHYFN